jgi:TolB-like protein/class 3 adenylate cyclase/tetratricopeptide (TPR) repeat protein
MERRLSAILAADVVGYSGLMEQDEAGTFDRLRAHRKELFEPEIEKHHGRIFKLTGDGLFAEFTSVVDAVECAVSLQRGLLERNANVAEDQRMYVRIGINLGEVIVEGDDRLGEGVNIAARLEQLAEPGGICVSAKVSKEVEKKLAFAFEPMGEQKVKNITEPVQVYKIKLDGPQVRPRPRRSRKMPLGVLAASTIAVLLILVAGFGAWFYRDHWMPTRQVSVEATGNGVPNSPTIAVLPFVNLSGDPNQEYFSDGLTEDLMTALARASSDLHVLARNTTFQYKDKAVDVPKIGRDLDARYVLEGSVRRAGDDLRITAQLIDAETGAHIWADKFDRKMADVFLVQDELVGQIVSKIVGGYGAIEINEAKSATQKTPQEIQAYDLVLRAHDTMMWEWNRANFRSAKEMLLQAIALDPSNARAHRELAYLDVIGWVFRFDYTPASPQEIIAQAVKAVQLDPADARARMVAATAYFFNKQLDLFERETEQAIALAPYDGEILAVLGYLIASSGQWERGVALVQKANTLNADAAIGWYQVAMFYNSYLKGDYARALEFRRLHPDQHAIYTYIEYIPVYGQLGRKEEALENWRKLLAEDGSWTAESFKNWYHLFNMRDEDVAKLMDGVYKSGVLGQEAKPRL